MSQHNMQRFQERLIQTLSERCGQPLQRINAPARWLAFGGLLGFFLVRTLLLRRAFYIIVYGEGIHLLAQLAVFCSPLNDPRSVLTMAATTRNLEDGGNDNDVESQQQQQQQDDDDEEQQKRRQRRIPEYNIWFYSCRGVMIATFMTFFDVLNVPVYWPILLAYFLLLAVWIVIRLILQQRAAAESIAVTKNGNQHNDKIEIHLVVQHYEFRHCTIGKILPWSASRSVPPLLSSRQSDYSGEGEASVDDMNNGNNTTHLDEWRAFLQDLEAAATVDPKKGNWHTTITTFLAQILVSGYLSHLALDYLMTHGDSIPCWDQETCNLTTNALLISFGPWNLYLAFLLWRLGRMQWQNTKESLERCQEICRHLERRHEPHVECECHQKQLGVRVYIRPKNKKPKAEDDKSTTSNNDDRATIPNPCGDWPTVPLLL